MTDKKYPKYVTPFQYAKLCGVSDTAIYGRIERGALQVVEETGLDGKVKRYIDTEQNPPERLINYPIEYKGKRKNK